MEAEIGCKIEVLQLDRDLARRIGAAAEKIGDGEFLNISENEDKPGEYKITLVKKRAPVAPAGPGLAGK